MGSPEGAAEAEAEAAEAEAEAEEAGTTIERRHLFWNKVPERLLQPTIFGEPPGDVQEMLGLGKGQGQATLTLTSYPSSGELAGDGSVAALERAFGAEVEAMVRRHFTREKRCKANPCPYPSPNPNPNSDPEPSPNPNQV